MHLLVVGLALLLGSAVVAILCARAERVAGVVAAAGGVAGCVAGLVPAAQVLGGTDLPGLRAPWNVPYGSLSIGVDPLSFAATIPPMVARSAAGGSSGSH